MGKFLSAAATAFCMASAITPAVAADIPLSLTCAAGNVSCFGAFSISPVTAGNFTQGFTFSLPLDGKLGGSVTTEFTVPIQDIDFTSIVVDGLYSFTKNALVIEPQERWSIAKLSLTGGPHRIDITGTSAGLASYGGTITFAAVPEPATWGLMILGFGMIGGALRNRRKAIVRYA